MDINDTLNNKATKDSSPMEIVKWPFEKYDNIAGDKVTIICYVPNGEPMNYTTATDITKSPDWYEIAVPLEHVENAQLHYRLKKNDPTLRTIIENGKPALLGWASVKWFHQNAHQNDVPLCGNS